MVKPTSKKIKSTPFKRSMVMDKSTKTSWKKKMQIKQEKMLTKALEETLKANKQEIIDEQRKRRQEKQERLEQLKKEQLQQTTTMKQKRQNKCPRKKLQRKRLKH